MNTQPTPGTWLRSTLFYIVFILSIPPTAVFLFLTRLVSIPLTQKAIRIWSRGVHHLLTGVTGIRFDLSLQVPADGIPTLIIANHTGPWETVGMYAVWPESLTYILKQDLISWKYNCFALGLRALDPVAISRVSNAGDLRKMVDGTRDRFAKGYQVLVFPQGTRTALSQVPHMGPGGMILAKKLGCRVLPLFIDSEAWARGSWIKDFGLVYPRTIRARTGDLIPAETVRTESIATLHQRCLDFFIPLLPAENRGQADATS